MRLRRAAQLVAVLAAALWIGGLVALGAVVAPVVFRMVPAPASADAMTVVFRRFDRVVIACAAVLLAVEVVLAVGRRARPGRLDLARGGAVVVASGLALVEAFYVSPRIAALHEAGAIRGLGALGMELHAVHEVAEGLAKLEL